MLEGPKIKQAPPEVREEGGASQTANDSRQAESDAPTATRLAPASQLALPALIGPIRMEPGTARRPPGHTCPRGRPSLAGCTSCGGSYVHW
eukprot:scaffold2437_cov395-Prasinococcus_capsulatus_cf.AAC.2